MIDLKTLITTYPECVLSRSKIISLLHDLYPLDKRAVNAVMSAYDDGIIKSLSGLDSLDRERLCVLSKRLIDDFGLQEQYALEGIISWAQAYDINVDIDTVDVKFQFQFLPSQKKMTMANDRNVFSKAGKVVSESWDDYKTYHTGAGVIIIKYTGPAIVNMVVPNVLHGDKIIGIGVNAYRGCNYMESLLISDGIKFIENGAFAECKNLTKVIFPESLERIGTFSEFEHLSDCAEGAFEGSGVNSVSLPPNLTYLGKSSFCHCCVLSSVYIYSDLLSIKAHTFMNCVRLEKISLPATLQHIEGGAFSVCIKLNGISFPNSLHIIESYAFAYCRSLKTIRLNEGLKEIGG